MSAARRVGLLFGGRSVEHEVSVQSARSVAAALAAAGFDCLPIGVTGEGRWLGPEASSVLLDSGASRVVEPPAPAERVVIDPGCGDLLGLGATGDARRLGVEVVFPLIHGWGGEDGRLQGALETAGIPYVGAGVSGSALGMDKILARQILDAQGLPSVRWMSLDATSYRRAPEAARRRVVAELGLPLFVKPSNGGSSVGVSRVAAESALPAAIEEALACDTRLVVEAAVPRAREIECAVLGNARPEASVLGEILPSREFYDYAAKYLDGTSGLEIPAGLDAEAAAAIRVHALAAFRSLGLAGLARVDFLVDRTTGRAYLNEVNTLPGFTSISMFPKLWEATGVPFPELVSRLVQLALERWTGERSLRTAWKPV